MTRTVLHEHLDGCLLPGTLLELANARGVSLGVDDEDGLRKLLSLGVKGSLAAYLRCFAMTTAVLQDVAALERVAFEHGEQMLAEGVTRAEVRFAPQLHGEEMHRSVEAVWRGLERSTRGTEMRAGVLVCGIRESDPMIVERAAQVACEMRGVVVGFDLAGMELGHLASAHRSALALVREGGLPLTLHAGEADGVASIRDALEMGATRLGHGVRLVEDIWLEDGEVVLGEVAQAVLDEQVVLEVCVSSNLDTRVFASLTEHPVLRLMRLGFAVTLQTDNRLMSQTTLEREEALVLSLGATAQEIEAMRATAAVASFVS
jgi:adenosine deaminase